MRVAVCWMNAGRRVLIRDQADRDAIAMRLVRYRDQNCQRSSTRQVTVNPCMHAQGVVSVAAIQDVADHHVTSRREVDRQ
jgi:hypothetical protein